MTPRRDLAPVAALLVLAAVTVAAFAGVLRNGWIIVDDSGYVYDNAVVSRGLTLDGTRYFLTHDHGANWVPVTALSHMLDVQLYGLRPAGHHLTNLLLHLANTVLVALLLRRLTGAWWRSLAVAALFALHPLRVESVAWIAERKDVLSAFFFLLTLWAWTSWVERPTRARYALVFAALLCGLWSKPMLVTTPFVLLLLDYWPLGRLATRGRPGPATTGIPSRKSWRGLLWEKAPLFALVGLVTAVTYRLQTTAGAVPDYEFFTFSRRAATAVLNGWRYLALLAWPRNLAPFHAHGGQIDTAGAALAAAGLVLATALALREAGRRPWLIVGWLWYLGTLLPASGLVQTGAHAWADRFTYIPCLGVLLALVWTMDEALQERPRGARVAAGVTLAALLVLAAATVRQTRVWSDTGTYAARVLTVEADNPLSCRVAHRWLGRWLVREGRLAEAKPHLEQGYGQPTGIEDRLRRTLAERPGDVETRRQLAALLTLESRTDEGVAEYRTILADDDADLDALVNIAWVRATHELATQRDGAEAVRLAQRAHDLCPEPLAVVESTLAAALAEAGRLPEAVAVGRRAVALARAEGQNGLAADYATQLRAYEAGRSFHFRN